MSMTEQLGPHLPYLRRFARALCGSQMSGDAYVVAALEAIVANREVLASDLEPRIALYKLFLTLWNDTPVNSGTMISGNEENRLDRLTPRSRQAFLLTAVEGFKPEAAATIMSVDAVGFAALSDAAAREIADQVATDVLIIEDEPIIAMDLEALVEGLGHRVTDVARTHKEAIAAVARKRPGLVLADIQLADGSSGLEAVNEILGSLEVPVIFITAYPERLLTGEKPEPAFLITKPFQSNTLKAVVSQALFFDEKSTRRDAA
ncbi:response regulator [Methylobrevis pamukkalensis]|uniref:Two-component response regulator n=1 Tax=Methylobrevis pamukkalensis TaxID=1439726 RepID=A0A1E3H6Z1_9HYPH|nr:response regulator [Methylobrevis pamukkalensis]ODN72093.1 two-component response regulator [Methylobrevis pamukkalensis]